MYSSLLTHARHVCGLFSCDVYRQQIPANLLLVKNISAIGLYWGNYAMVAIARPFDNHSPSTPPPPRGAFQCGSCRLAYCPYAPILIAA